MGKGKCHYIFEQYLQALSVFNTVIKLRPDFDQAYYYRGNVYNKLHIDNDALNDYSKAIHLNDKFTYAYIQRAYLYRKLKDFDGALNDFNIAISIGVNEADVYYNRADLLIKEYNKIEKAIDDFSKAIELDSELKEAFYQRGICYEKIKKYKEASDDLTKCMELGLRDTLIYRKRANAFFQSGNYEKAIDDYSVLIKKYKVRDEISFFNRGISFCKLASYENAVKDFTKVLMLNRENVEAYLQRAYCNMKHNLISTALADYKNAELYAPKNPKIYEGRGDLYRNNEKYQDAIINYTKSLSLKTDSEVYLYRAICKEKLNDHDGACADYNNASVLGQQDAVDKVKTYCK